MKHNLYSHAFKVMGGPAQVQYCAADRLPELEQAVEIEARRLESKYSRYQAGSILSKINATAAKAGTTVDDETASLIQFAFAAYEQSRGLFDITSGVLRRVWDFSEPKMPEPKQLESCLKLVGLEKVKWSNPVVKLTQEGMELDFGGIVKEYAVDRCAALVEEAGVDGFVNFAGDLRVSTAAGSGKKWSIGIVHPRLSHTSLRSILLRQGAMATSGDYERFIEVDGRRHYHILNPKTGYSVTGLQSVTVLAPSCSLAGIASTTAMLLGYKKALRYLNDLGFACVIVRENGMVESREV